MWRALQTGGQVLVWPRPSWGWFIPLLACPPTDQWALVAMTLWDQWLPKENAGPLLPIVTFPRSIPKQTYCLYVVMVFTWFFCYDSPCLLESSSQWVPPVYYLRQEPHRGSRLGPPKLCSLRLGGFFVPSHFLEFQHAHSRPLVKF